MASYLPILSLVFVLGALLVVQWQYRGRPVMLVLAAATGNAMVALASFLPPISSELAKHDGVQHNTYYVVAHFHWSLNIAILYVLLASTLWAQGRWLHHPIPRAVSPLIWMNVLGLVISSLGSRLLMSGALPRRYLHYDQLEPLWITESWAAFVAYLALLSLALLLLWAVATHLVHYFRVCD